MSQQICCKTSRCFLAFEVHSSVTHGTAIVILILVMAPPPSGSSCLPAARLHLRCVGGWSMVEGSPVGILGFWSSWLPRYSRMARNCEAQPLLRDPLLVHFIRALGTQKSYLSSWMALYAGEKKMYHKISTPQSHEFIAEFVTFHSHNHLEVI